MKAAHQKKAAEKLASLPEAVRNRVKAARKVEVRVPTCMLRLLRLSDE